MMNSDYVRLKIADGIHIPFSKELALRLTLCLAWVPLLLNYLRGVYIRVPLIGEQNVDKAIAISVAFCVLCSLPALINRFCLLDYAFYFLNVFYVVSCYAFFPENGIFLDELAPICIFQVFVYYFVGRLIDIEHLFPTLVFLSAVCIFADIYYYLYLVPQDKSAGEAIMYDNMNGAYMILPHVLMLLWSTLETFRIWKAFVTVIGLLFLLSCGTRGPFLCIAFFGIIYFFFYMNFRGAIYVKTGIITFAAVLIANLNSVLYSITMFFAERGLSTRILEHFASGEMENDTHRSVLREKLESVLQSGDHFWGLGAFGCRNHDVIYSHFMPLDVASTFGYFTGYLILLLLAVLIVTALRLSRGTKRQVFIVFLISLGIVKLFLSNTFLLEPYFYMLIGVCMKEVLEAWLSTASARKSDESLLNASSLP